MATTSKVVKERNNETERKTKQERKKLGSRNQGNNGTVSETSWIRKKEDIKINMGMILKEKQKPTRKLKDE